MINFMHVHWNVVHYCTGLQPAAMWKLRSPRRIQAEADCNSSLFVHSLCTKQFFDHLGVPLCSPAPLAEKRTCPHNYCEDGVKHCHRVLDNGLQSLNWENNQVTQVQTWVN